MARTYGKAQDLIDFTRASNGTALRRVKYGAELVTNGTFDADLSGWTAGSSWSWVSGKAYDGDTATSPNSWLSQDVSTTVGTVYRWSFDIADLSGGTPSAAVDTVALETITANGHYDIYFVATTTTTEIRFSGSGALYSVDNVSVKEVLFDQPDGTLTLFNHPANIPRIEYDADGNLLGLLVEESRTNLWINSEILDNTSKSRMTVTEDQAIAPDGNQTADKLNENGDTGVHNIYNTYTVTSGVAYTFSMFAKAGERNYFKLGLFAAGSPVLATYDLSSGTIYAEDAGATATIEDAGSGWYRCAITVTTSTTTYLAVIRVLEDATTESYTGTIGSGIYGWGAQLEAGSFPTSYIPTSGSTATRSADVASIDVTEFGYNQSEGTVVVEGTPAVFDVNGRFFAISDGTVNNRIEFTTGFTYHPLVVDGGTTQANIDAGAFIAGVFVKVGAVFENNNFAGVINGGTVVTDSSGTVPTVNTLYIGGKANTNVEQAIHIKSLKYYPRALTATQIQELTS